MGVPPSARRACRRFVSSCCRCLCFAALLGPLMVEVEETPRDSLALRVSVAGSKGSYVNVRHGGCGELLEIDTHRFREVSGAADVDFPGPMHAGVRVSHLVNLEGGNPRRREAGGLNVWNPYLAVEKKYVGAGFGFLVRPTALQEGDLAFAPVSGHLRFGRAGSLSGEHVYVSASLNESQPIFAGGAGDLGLGITWGANFRGWLGASSTAPYDKPGALVRVEYRPRSGLGLGVQGRMGSSGGHDESCLALQLSYSTLLATSPNRRPAEILKATQHSADAQLATAP